MPDGEENEVWNKREGEPSLWYSRFLTYLNMGPARSLLGAENLDKVRRGLKKSEGSASGAWRDACKLWEWKKRANAHDEEQERIALAESKYARVSERVKLLELWVSTQNTIMIESVADKGYVRADTMEQLRGLIDDIAKETGGRVKVTKNDTANTFDVAGAAARLMQKLGALPDDDDHPQSS